ncbi:hypothetical protein GLOIN_2v1765872 [Rhizophagus irregularis DAOM 181602=DAOM 197198]|nr:hypothetical protein GLOIN_2v1765872 [Rhizophagus irregularis DAOM 181602=DAOM 197198]
MYKINGIWDGIWDMGLEWDWDLGLEWDYDKWDGINGIWDGIWVGWDMGFSQSHLYGRQVYPDKIIYKKFFY